MPPWTGRLVLTLVVAGLVVAAVLGVGQLLTDGLRDDARYQVAFADIACVPPGPLSREEFLGEVQYLADLPDRLSTLDKDQTRKLALAFGAHPWVERVDGVRVGSPAKIEVRYTARVPVLAVAVAGRAEPVPVDRHGVLLPAKALSPDLPTLAGVERAATTPTGSVWADAAVRAAAKTAGHLHGDLGRLGLTGLRVDGEDVTLAGEKCRVVWGRPPGAEADGEASAEIKKQRLLEAATPEGGLAGSVHDLRPADAPSRRPLGR